MLLKCVVSLSNVDKEEIQSTVDFLWRQIDGSHIYIEPADPHVDINKPAQSVFETAENYH